MKKFEEREFNGALAEYLEECKQHRIKSIYNYEYRYIKEIIYDTEKEERYGTERDGYEQYKKETKGSLSYGGEVSLRTNTTDGEIDGYVSEEKLKENINLNKMKDILSRAKQHLMNTLMVKDIGSFEYWLATLDTGMMADNKSVNGITAMIEFYEWIIEAYQGDKDYKKYVDKIVA